MESFSGWRGCAAVIGALVVALLWSRSANHGTTSELQAAVLGDGFAATYIAGDQHRVVELDRDGTRRAELAIAHTGDVRVVGTSNGSAAAWKEGRKLRLARVADGRELGVWGNDVRTLCEGVASNDERFGVGWLEGDGRIWYVHGPTARPRASEVGDAELADVGIAEPSGWCGIASAGPNVALFWRDGDRLFLNMCSKKKCSAIPGGATFDRRDALLGFGCIRDACLVAARSPGGKTRLALITESGAVKWQKPLDTTAVTVSIVGAGAAFAVGYAAGEGPTVARVTRKGEIANRWRASETPVVPAIAWSADRLLIARFGGGALVSTSVEFPR